MFKYHDKVIVTNPDLMSYNNVGIVARASFTTTDVTFYNWRNTGLNKTLNIHNENLRLCNDKDDISNNIHYNKGEQSMLVVKGNYNVATVNFLQGTNTTKGYAFALFDSDIVIGDNVLCDTANGYSVGRVVDIIPQNEWNGTTVTKEVICKVDFSAFKKRKELRKQKEDLKKQMDKMVADNQELILYQAIADKNPEMAAMLQAYKALSDV